MEVCRNILNHNILNKNKCLAFITLKIKLDDNLDIHYLFIKYKLKEIIGFKYI